MICNKPYPNKFVSFAGKIVNYPPQLVNFFQRYHELYRFLDGLHDDIDTLEQYAMVVQDPKY